MAILEDKVWMRVSNNFRHYEQLGYKIPKHRNNVGELKVNLGDKFLAYVKHLPKGSEIRLTRICDSCGKEDTDISYKRIINARLSHQNKDFCFRCSRKISAATKMRNVKVEDSIGYKFPSIIEEWDHTKNKMSPHHVSYGSNRLYWWICTDCESSYSMSAKQKCVGIYGCPYCRGLRVNDTNCLDVIYPNIAKEWNFVRNGKTTPKDVTFGSAKKVWWTCGNCNHEWHSSIGSRTTNNTGCPRCCSNSKGESNILEILYRLNILFFTQKTFNNCKNINLLPYDFYIHDIILIEYDGLQHFQNRDFFGGIESFGYTQVNDKIKNQYCIDNSIPLIRIPYWEFNNMEYIIDNVLKYFNIIEGQAENKDIVEKYLVGENWNHDEYISQAPCNKVVAN